MSVKRLDLYIDESGDFNDARPDRPMPQELSMVGGLLCDPAWLTKNRMDSMLPNRVHAKDGYDKRYLNVLEDLLKASCQFVVFENTERIRVVNPQITYANIISEGLVKLFRDLAAEYPDGVQVHVVIAQRQLQLAQYRDRLIEKVRMAYGRTYVTGCDYDLEISDARFDKRLFFADIICNTYMTRSRDRKFSPEEQERIQHMFSSQWIYPVFEDATVMYIKQLFADQHYGEMMHQISTLPRLLGVTNLRDRLIRHMVKASRAERAHWFSQMSLEVGLYNNARMFEEGIALAKNYQRYFLDHFADISETAAEARYWTFDTDFYLLTMYDHLGSTGKCSKYLEACRNNITSVNCSWEHMDYYFRFRLRELNILMGRFAFNELLQKADEMVVSFNEVSAVFHKIGQRDGTGSSFQSELLGKVQGIRLEALINLVTKNPVYYDEALQASDKALREFSRPDDLRRQWQYRAQLMVVAGKIQEARECVLHSLNIDPYVPDPYTCALNEIYKDVRRTDDYSLLHYTNVLLGFVCENSPEMNDMGVKLLNDPRFLNDLRNRKGGGHPWNRILWNIAQFANKIKDYKLAENCYKQALAVTRANPDHMTMMTYAVSITAERLYHSDHLPPTEKVVLEKDWSKANQDLIKGGAPQETLDWFGTESPDVTWQAKAWLK